MSAKVLHGVGPDILTLPEDGFVHAMHNLPARMSARLAFMTRGHHLVRDFVVRELPRQRGPLQPARIAQTTGLELQEVTRILADLEQHLFFLVRDAAGNVSWAFPVPTSRTPHRLTFSTGEKTFGA
ncbi:MAG: hypothetical protein WCC59_17560 [Terriglobales bacterium]